jgi:2-aminoadipate transaminase
MASSVHYSVRVQPYFANWMCGNEPQALRKLMGIVGRRPNILSFALGWPDPALFPRAAISAALVSAIDENPLALQLGPPLPDLRREIAALMRRRGVACDESQVFLTAGAQQALDLLARLLVDPGASVVVEEVTYPGMHMALRPLAPTYCYVPTDERDGMDVDALQALLSRTRPRFIYVMSDGHNPLGVSLAPSKRRRLVELARAHQVPIIEDDPYGFFQYGSGDPLAPMRALDDEWVYYVGSFSKIVAPGLRVGWIVAPEHLIPKLSIVKDLSDIDGCTLVQHGLARFLAAGALAPHVDTLRREYRERRDAMLGALERHMPEGTRWSTPQSGMFVWAQLPSTIDTTILLEHAIERGVAFLPGPPFAPGSRIAASAMRLCFASCPRDRIEDGVATIGALATQALDRPTPTARMVGA